MSFLYHRKTKGIIKWVFGIAALVIIISMVFAYSGGGQLF